jgi:hypothetical protein
MDNLIDLVIAQIEEDIKGTDLLALEELLRSIPRDKLMGYLPESVVFGQEY